MRSIGNEACIRCKLKVYRDIILHIIALIAIEHRCSQKLLENEMFYGYTIKDWGDEP